VPIRHVRTDRAKGRKKMTDPVRSSAELGDRVRARRRALRLTQAGTAELAGCSPRFIVALEAGKPAVQMDKVLAVLDVLGLDLSLAPREPS